MNASIFLILVPCVVVFDTSEFIIIKYHSTALTLYRTVSIADISLSLL